MTEPDDQDLDDRLRSLPVPAGLAARVELKVLFDSPAVDRLLCGVRVPSGLGERVRQRHRSHRDWTLPPADVHQPSGPAVPRAAARPRPAAGHGGPIRGWLAAGGDLVRDGGAVLASLAVVFLMVWAGTELSRRLADSEPDRRTVAAGAEVPAGAGDGRRIDNPSAEAAGTRDRSTGPERIAVSSPAPGTAPAGRDGPVGEPMNERAALASNEAGGVGQPSVGRRPRVEVRAAPVSPASERSPPGSPMAGSRAAGRLGPGGIRTVLLPAPGRPVPRLSGYDVAFEMAHGEPPFTDPSRSPGLATDRPPLSLRTGSFDAVWAQLEADRDRPSGRQRRMLSDQSIRVEEVLAAIPPDEAGGGVTTGGSTPLVNIRRVR